MKKILIFLTKIVMVLIVILAIAYTSLNIIQTRQDSSVVEINQDVISNIQEMNIENALEQDAFFKKEFPNTKIPLLSINVIDVKNENYEKVLNNIEHQQAVMAMFMSDRYEKTFHFTVQNYGEIKRIFWINDFDYPYFNELYAQAELKGKESRKGWDNLWNELGDLVEGYLWWASPVLDDQFIPSANNTESPSVAENIQTGINNPYSIIPKTNSLSLEKLLQSMLMELKSNSKKYFSVSVLEVSKNNYDQTYTSIQKIQSRFYEELGQKYVHPFQYSTQQYGDTIRILWVNEFDKEQFEQIESIYSDKELWTKYMSHVDNYLWWSSQEIEVKQKVHIHLLQKIKMILKMIKLSF